MANVAAGNEIDDVLRNVGGVVADAFEIFCHQDQLKRGEHHRGIFHHVGEQFAEELIAQPVHLVIPLQDTLRQIEISTYQRVQAVANHSFGEFTHAGQIHVGLHLRVAQNAHGGLRDVHGLIADAFQVAIDA